MNIKAFKKLTLCLLLSASIFLLLPNESFSAKNKTKILLIGLDGATWKVMTPLIKEGKLPNIKQLMDKGCWGGLQSFAPFRSEQIWTTIATGKEPKEHGILDRLMEDPDTGESVPVTSNLIKVKRIWNILNEHRKIVGIVNYLVTWPPEEINGVMISDRINTDVNYLSKDYSYPPFAKICNKSKFQEIINVKDDVILKIFSGITEGGKEDNYFTFDLSSHWNFAHFIGRLN